MKKIAAFFILYLLTLSLSHADTLPLRVAISDFTPPFVMHATKKEYFGFDIALAEYICKMLERQCVYIPMNFDALIPAIEENKADIAISAITINLEQSKIVRFSIPYMISQVEYVVTRENTTLNPAHLDNTTIGIMQGTIFGREINSMAFTNTRIIEYKRFEDILSALKDKIIDAALLRAPSAHYWKNISSGKLQTIGSPFSVGYGLGIIANIENKHLIDQINLAILHYQNSSEFKKNYTIYLEGF